MLKQKKMNFKKFCAIIKKYVLNPVSINELNEMYIAWKKGNETVGYESVTEFILNHYGEWNLTTHTNCLKRNKDKH